MDSEDISKELEILYFQAGGPQKDLLKRLIVCINAQNKLIAELIHEQHIKELSDKDMGLKPHANKRLTDTEAWFLRRDSDL